MENVPPCNVEMISMTTLSRVESAKSYGSVDKAFHGETMVTREMKQDESMTEEESSPVSMENGAAPLAKTPTPPPKLPTPPTMSAKLLKQLPFRERNLEDGRRLIPPHITVPPKKAFGYPERYRSPTDAMVSPVSRGLLTRNRRAPRTLAPIGPPKALENTFQDVAVEVVLPEH